MLLCILSILETVQAADFIGWLVSPCYLFSSLAARTEMLEVLHFLPVSDEEISLLELSRSSTRIKNQ